MAQIQLKAAIVCAVFGLGELHNHRLGLLRIFLQFGPFSPEKRKTIPGKALNIV